MLPEGGGWPNVCPKIR